LKQPAHISRKYAPHHSSYLLYQAALLCWTIGARIIIRPLKALIRPFKGLIRLLKGLIRSLKGLIRPFKGRPLRAL
jgi:hypothetical protein